MRPHGNCTHPGKNEYAGPREESFSLLESSWPLLQTSFRPLNVVEFASCDHSFFFFHSTSKLQMTQVKSLTGKTLLHIQSIIF